MSVYHLPNTLRNWPWQRMVHPDYHVAKRECETWATRFKVSSIPDMERGRVASGSSLLASHFYPIGTLYNLRSVCDLMHTFWVIDDATDKLDAASARSFCDAIFNAIQYPNQPPPEEYAVEAAIAREFWQRASVTAPVACQERFINAWRMYLDGTAEQAARREIKYICTLDEYFAHRRRDIGADPCYAFIEITLELDLPREVMDHRAVISINQDATDMIILANDMCSYKKEAMANEADNNIVTVLMTRNQTDIAGAMQWISDRHDELVEHFFAIRDDILGHRNGIPAWGPNIDTQIEKYIDVLGRLVRANDQWMFECGRYFGDQAHEIQLSRTVIIG
ncbi:isoprenoid synthase domain-containing protein [Mycena capillaripes]|nr:isoprenoid synthase domain-containing protein [Mycena capillaripes]